MKRAFLLTLSTGCWSAEFDRADAWIREHDAAASTSSTTAGGGAGEVGSGTGEAEPERWTTGGVHTVTGPDIEESSGPESPAAPAIPVLVASPSKLDGVGATTIVARAERADRLRVELDGVLLAEGDASELEVVWEALSSDDNGPSRIVRATAEGPGGITVRETELVVTVPAGGELVWLFDQKSSLYPERIAVAGESTYILGSRFLDGKLRLELLCLHAGALVWARTIDQWSNTAAALADDSFGTDVDVTPSGEILVSGNLSGLDGVRSYWARLAPDGTRISERTGNLGEAAYAIAAGPDGEAVLGGSEPTGTGSRLRWWSFDGGDVPIGSGKAETMHPDAQDRVWAIDVDSEGAVWVAGGVGIYDLAAENLNSPRAFLGRWSLSGALPAMWSSPVGPAVAMDVVGTPEGACVAGASLGAGFVRCFDPALTSVEERSLTDTVESRGIGRTRRGDVVTSASTKNTALALALAAGELDGAPRWSVPSAVAMFVVTARALDCDAWGYCQLLTQRQSGPTDRWLGVLKLTP